MSRPKPKARATFDPSAWEAEQAREARIIDRHPVLEYLPDLEQALAAKGFPPMSPWWLEQVQRFYGHPTARRMVLRVGRRGGKSSSLCRVAVLEGLHGEHTVTPGDVGVIAFISVRREEAEQRLRMIRAILDAIGVAHHPTPGGLELDDRPIAFRVFPATHAAVIGFTCICAICDEVAKWRDADTGANPATEVLTSLKPTMATQRAAKLFLSSSPLGLLDAHAAAFDEGDTAGQLVAFAPSWVANPTLTEAQTRADEPDEAKWRREYAAIPLEDMESALLSAALLDKCTRKMGDLPPRVGWSYVAAMDPGTRGNAWTFVLATRDLAGLRIVVAVYEWRGTSSKPLDPRAVLKQISAICRPYGVRYVTTDQWSGDALAALGRDEAIGLNLVVRSLTSGEKLNMWDDVVTWFSDGQVEIPEDKTLRSDLLGVRRRVTQNGLGIRYAETPDGRHSDYAPAVALALDQHCPEPSRMPQKGSSEQVEADALARDLAAAKPRKGPWWKGDPIG